MLKFFSGRDDENESLLGAITEGKSCEQQGTDASLHFADYRVILRDSAGYAENADTAFLSAHKPHQQKRARCRDFRAFQAGTSESPH